MTLLKVLDAGLDDMDKESSNITLQPGDSVVRPIDDEGHAALRENATGEAEFLVVPYGFGGTFLKEMQDVTDADYKAKKTYLEEEAAFVEAESERLIDNLVREQAINMDLEIESLLEEDEPGAWPARARNTIPRRVELFGDAALIGYEGREDGF